MGSENNLYIDYESSTKFAKIIVQSNKGSCNS